APARDARPGEGQLDGRCPHARRGLRAGRPHRAQRPGGDLMADAMLPLEGIRVVDFAQVFAGPACTRILADLGADVVRFEAATRMDVTRNLIISDNDGKDHHWLRASYFVVRNASKREMVIDLTKEEGREIIRKLVAESDVVTESFTP